MATVKFANDNSKEQQTSATIYAIEPRVDELTKTIKVTYNGNEHFYPGSLCEGVCLI